MLTMMSAPRRMARSSPVRKILPSPGRLLTVTTIAPAAVASSAVRSVDPSLTTMTSTSLTPEIFRGTPATTFAMVAASFWAGIVTTSFMRTGS
jgi:hypothetical protein